MSQVCPIAKPVLAMKNPEFVGKQLGVEVVTSDGGCVYCMAWNVHLKVSVWPQNMALFV